MFVREFYVFAVRRLMKKGGKGVFIDEFKAVLWMETNLTRMCCAGIVTVKP
jgi:hypothetical protein